MELMPKEKPYGWLREQTPPLRASNSLGLLSNIEMEQASGWKDVA